MNKWDKSLLIILLGKTLFLMGLVIFFPIPLSPDEAQYWTWSRNLDWGYFSKPPGIAWQIWLTSYLFGHNHLGVRGGALIIGYSLAWAVFLLAKACGLDSKKCFWAGVIMALSPIGVYLSFAATTDGGSILFLTLAVIVIAKSLKEDKKPNYTLFGFLLCMSLLFKWTALVIWPLLFAFWIFYPSLRSKGVLMGLLLSLIALVPSFYWNVSHDFATFKHVGKTVSGTLKSNPLEFLCAEIALFTPVFFFLFLKGVFRKKSPELVWCTSIPLIAFFYFMASFFKKMQPNWPAFLYPSAMVVAAWVGSHKWLRVGTIISTVSLLLLFLIPLSQEHFNVIPFAANPFQQCMGNSKLAHVLKESGFDENRHFLFADKYQTTSLLSFYNNEKMRAYFFNLIGSRKNQFCYWPTMQEETKGKDGYFVVIEKTNKKEALNWTLAHYQDLLTPFFGNVEPKGCYPLFAVAGEPVKYAILFNCENYLGESPQDPERY